MKQSEWMRKTRATQISNMLQFTFSQFIYNFKSTCHFFFLFFRLLRLTFFFAGFFFLDLRSPIAVNLLQNLHWQMRKKSKIFSQFFFVSVLFLCTFSSKRYRFFGFCFFIFLSSTYQFPILWECIVFIYSHKILSFIGAIEYTIYGTFFFFMDYNFASLSIDSPHIPIVIC